MNIAFIQIFHNPGKSLIPTLRKNLDLLGADDRFYVVLDGCTDNSQSLAQEFIGEANNRVTVIHTPDLHEILALNCALAETREHNPRAVVHLQGDMIVEPLNFDIVRGFLYSRTDFGIASLRMGGCPSKEISEFNFSEGAYGHKGGMRFLGAKLYVAEVCVVVRGPLILSDELLDLVGWQIDPKLAPHSYDDIDLSLISRESGFTNYFIETPYRSDVTWGTTRNENRSFTESVDISYSKNKQYVYEKHSLNQSWSLCPGHGVNLTLAGLCPSSYYWRGMLFNSILTYPDSRNLLVHNLMRVCRKLAFKLSNRDFESGNKVP